jgi:hypothetical protein
METFSLFMDDTADTYSSMMFTIGQRRTPRPSFGLIPPNGRDQELANARMHFSPIVQQVAAYFLGGIELSVLDGRNNAQIFV